MLFHIIKRDFMRTKTMSLVLWLFIVLSSLFVTSSVSNMLTIFQGTDHYLREANVRDFVICAMGTREQNAQLEEFLQKSKYAEDLQWSEHPMLLNCFYNEEGEEKTLSSYAIIEVPGDSGQVFFDTQNEAMTEVEEGTAYTALKNIEALEIEAGDSIQIRMGEEKLKLQVQQTKDALFGSTMMGMGRFVVSQKDYDRIVSMPGVYFLSLIGMTTDDPQALEKELAQSGISVLSALDRADCKTTYIMDMVIAAMLFVVSMLLILFACMVLRFTIAFSISEEYREIGVMKALGIPNPRIRCLYIYKYLAMAVTGVTVGLILGIPFGDMFLKTVNQNMVLPEGLQGISLRLVSAGAIVAMVLLFCYSCTRKVIRISPVSAIRNGKEGERFHRKGIFSLSHFKLGNCLFLIVSELTANAVRYVSMLLIFIVGTLLVTIPVSTADTLGSKEVLTWLNMYPSDYALTNMEEMETLVSSADRQVILNEIERKENFLRKNGIPGQVFCEAGSKMKISFQNESISHLAFQGTGIASDRYGYLEGTAPVYEGEVALTYVTADAIGAGIGDRVTIASGKNGVEKEYIVTALYESMLNMGEGIRFSEVEEISYENIAYCFGYQLEFEEELSEKEIEGRREKLQEIFSNCEVYTGEEFAVSIIGDIAGMVRDVSNVIISVILLVNIFVVILMMKTFLIRENSDIALMKAIGMKERTLILWQAGRIGMILILAVIIAALISKPMAQIMVIPVFEMMGASRIDLVIKPFEIYFLCPLLLFTVTFITGILMALGIRKVNVREFSKGE